MPPIFQSRVHFGPLRPAMAGNPERGMEAYQAHLFEAQPHLAMPCQRLFLPTQNTRFKRSFTLMQSKLMDPTCARHHVNCKGTHKEVKNFLTLANAFAARGQVLGKTEGPEHGVLRCSQHHWVFFQLALYLHKMQVEPHTNKMATTASPHCPSRKKVNCRHVEAPAFSH